jgi:hypothetical protein
MEEHNALLVNLRHVWPKATGPKLPLGFGVRKNDTHAQPLLDLGRGLVDHLSDVTHYIVPKPWIQSFFDVGRAQS